MGSTVHAEIPRPHTPQPPPVALSVGCQVPPAGSPDFFLLNCIVMVAEIRNAFSEAKPNHVFGT